MMRNQSQAITVDFDVPATMRDGVVLRANVYRPAGEGRWPVLLTRLPYGKDLPLGRSILDPVQAARRGYVVIVQDTRGCGTSGGDWYPFRPEPDDGVDTIAWAANLPFSNGQVGMYGASYFGFTQWSAAVQQPPPLKAMVPFVTWADPLDGIMYRDGAAELGLAASWTLMMGMGVLFRRHVQDPVALGRAGGLQRRDGCARPHRLLGAAAGGVRAAAPAEPCAFLLRYGRGADGPRLRRGRRHDHPG